MRKLKKNLISTFGFLLLIALTVAIYYLLPYEKLLMDKTTLFGVVVSEVITLLGTLFYNTVSGKKKLTMTAGGYTILFGYQVLVIVLSMLFAFYYRNAIATYKIIFVCLTGVFLISSVLVYFFGKKVCHHFLFDVFILLFRNIDKAFLIFYNILIKFLQVLFIA